MIALMPDLIKRGF